MIKLFIAGGRWFQQRHPHYTAEIAGLASVLLVGWLGNVAGFAWLTSGRFAFWGAGLTGGLTCVLGLACYWWINSTQPSALRLRWLVRGALGLLSLGLVIGVLLAPAAPPAAIVAAGVIALAIMLVGDRVYRAVVALVRQRVVAQQQEWAARLRAARLTRRMLGYAAYRQLRRDGALPVPSQLHPHRTYLVPMRTTPSGARILVLENERPIGGLCLRPRQPLPDPEEALAHILAIRTNERAWLARANFFPQDRALTPQALGLATGPVGNYDR